VWRASTPARTIICPSPSSEELLARIRAVLRRRAIRRPRPLLRSKRPARLKSEGAPGHLSRRSDEITALEFDILEIWCAPRDERYRATSLLRLYQRPATPYERSLDVHISHLRKKLERKGDTPIARPRVGIPVAP